MRKTYCRSLSVICLFLINFTTTQAQTGAYVPELQRVDEVVTTFMQRWDIPGASVAITKDGRLVYARGFGEADQATHTLVNPTHRFRIASVSKPITSLAIMQLVQMGQLTFSAPVFGPKGILRDKAYAHPRDSRVLRITVRHLLQHTAGWDRAVGGDPMSDPVRIAKLMHVPAPADPGTIIRYVLRRKLNFAPGTRFVYSNVGYCILGRVIEKITGLSYERYVSEAILRPLGATGIELGKNLRSGQLSNEVSYYESRGDGKVASVYGRGEQVPWSYGGFHLEGMDANGGWVASASDLLRLMVGVDGFDTKPDLLQPVTIEQMVQPPANLDSFYAMGWCVNDSNHWWHTGSLPGTSTLLTRTNDGLTWTIMFNRRSNNPAYFQELDQLMWSGLRNVTRWPSYDLFETHPLGGPLVLRTSVGSAAGIALHWQGITHASGYVLERSVDDASQFIPLALVAADDTAFTDLSVAPNVSYTYRVRATSPYGTSNYSAPVSQQTLPDVPAQLLVTGGETAAGNRITWAFAAAPNVFFTVERAPLGSASFTTLHTTPLATSMNSHSDHTAVAGTSYVYRVSAQNAAGRTYSAESTPVITGLALAHQPRVYPNPTTGPFTVELLDKGARNVEITVTNYLGQVVKTMKPERSAVPWKHLIQLDHLPSGSYYVLVNSSLGTSQSIVIKE